MRGQGNAVRSEGNKGQEMKAFFHDRGHLSLGYKRVYFIFSYWKSYGFLTKIDFYGFFSSSTPTIRPAAFLAAAIACWWIIAALLAFFPAQKWLPGHLWFFNAQLPGLMALYNWQRAAAAREAAASRAAWRRSTRLQRLWRSIVASEYMYRTRQALWDIKNLSISYISGACEPPIYSLSIPAKNLYLCWLFI